MQNVSLDLYLSGVDDDEDVVAKSRGGRSQTDQPRDARHWQQGEHRGQQVSEERKMQ